MTSKSGQVRVGVGGWTYEPWRGTFYPPRLPQRRELEYASGQLTAIEINGTYYRTQSPTSFAKWRDETPDDFVFSVKGPRYATNRAVLREAGESIERFMSSGLMELRAKLGPILWQFAPTKRFDAEDFGRFLELLPQVAGGYRLRHVLDVRHASFMHSDFVALARSFRAAITFTDSDDYPSFADMTSDFVYARLMRATAAIDTGYSSEALDAWAERVRTWARGGEPADLPRVQAATNERAPRDVFIFMINGAKERAPAAARQLLACLGPKSRAS
ncbi:MAG: DUF72 domain-containing protein [Betaproteobacteria bacterium]|nr:DUF72 domain-containing protein [Betaproteobacteria bacterium]